jgi:hypothetical protein
MYIVFKDLIRVCVGKQEQETLCVGPWSRKVFLRNIEKDGNTVDKENLPQTDGHRNSKHSENRKKHRKLSTHKSEERRGVRRRLPPLTTPTPTPVLLAH